MSSTAEVKTRVNRKVTVKLGGKGGEPFSPILVENVALKTGGRVDAIVLNGTKHGGSGGDESDTLHLDVDEYIDKINAHENGVIQHLEIKTNKGAIIRGGKGEGEVNTLNNIRVLSLGGRSGKALDRLDVTFLENYQPSRLVENNAKFILGFISQGSVFTQYNQEESRMIESYEKVVTKMNSQTINAGVEVDYFVKASIATEIRFENTEIETVRRQLEQKLKSEGFVETTIKDKQIGVILAEGTIMQGINSDGKATEEDIWMFPTTAVSYVVISLKEYKSLLDRYDLTGGGIEVAMPQLKKHAVKRNGFTFFKK